MGSYFLYGDRVVKEAGSKGVYGAILHSNSPRKDSQVSRVAREKLGLPPGGSEEARSEPKAKEK